MTRLRCVPFPETDLSIASSFRHASASVTQQMVDNPNSLLQGDLQTSGQNMKGRVFLQVTTAHAAPVPAGGTVQHGVPGGLQPSGGQRQRQAGRLDILDPDPGRQLAAAAVHPARAAQLQRAELAPRDGGDAEEAVEPRPLRPTTKPRPARESRWPSVAIGCWRWTVAGYGD